jgi:GNAT superfamily N-acetyltransferase
MSDGLRGATMTPFPPPDKEATVSPTPTRIDLHHLVRKSRATDLVAMGDVLAAAFHDDPVLSWMVPDEPRRRATLPGLMRLLAARFQPHGENHINDTGTGAAVWSPPHATFSQDDDEWFESELVGLAGVDLARIGEVVELLESNHPKDSHYYLNLLGVTPDQQGHGVGSALLRAVLDRADREGAAAYLEATSPKNRALYERHGFAVSIELRCSDCPPLWAMWRRPQGA